ncbi:MAG: monovalent cation/hydrogen antiporter [Mycobacterium sp.]|jgi:CPA1 family monovalent cation:H+ antiporter|nr:monovalent cation/hydrogen antiporter [Mycobacterium sp.]
MLLKDRHVIASLLLLLVGGVLVAALARRYHLSSALVLVVAGLAIGLIPGVPTVELEPEFVLSVILPPLLWSAGLESSYVAMRKNIRPIALLAVGLPLATTFAVGFVAYYTVPQLTAAGALALGAIVAPPDAVSASSIGRRLGLPRQIMTLLGGESLLNDATALTLYKVSLAAAVGAAVSWGQGAVTFVLAAVGGVVVAVVFGVVIDFIRSRLLDDPVMESAIGLVAPFVVYFVAESIHGSGVLAVVVAALMLGQRSTHAGYATRLQDQAVWRAVQLILEAVAFLLIGLQLPSVVRQLKGMPALGVIWCSVAVFVTVIVVRIVWIYVFAYLPRTLFAGSRKGDPKPAPGQVFVLAWAGMRGVVSLAAAFAVPLTTVSGAPFPGRPHIVFLTFIVVVGTLLLHGLTLPWVIRRFCVHSDDVHQDAVKLAAAQDRATRAAAEKLDEVLAEQQERGPTEVHENAATILQHWNERRRNAAWEQLGRSDDEIGESPASAFKRLRLEMLAAERNTFISERDAGRIDDEVLRAALRGLDLEEATLRRD